MKIIKKREDDNCLLSKSRSIKRLSHKKSDHEKLTDAVVETLAGYRGNVPDMDEFLADVVAAASHKGVPVMQHKRKYRKR